MAKKKKVKSYDEKVAEQMSKEYDKYLRDYNSFLSKKSTIKLKKKINNK